MSGNRRTSSLSRSHDGGRFLLNIIPAPWAPFFELMRLDRPHGILYFYLPHLFGAVHAAIILNAGPTELMTVSIILLAAVITMRGATCSWNDLVDAPLDRMVERTQHRPIARRAISPPAAMIFIVVQAMCSCAWLLCLPFQCALHTLPSIAGVTFYPWSKRLTDCPQVVCALVMGWAVFVGEAAMGLSPLFPTPSNDAPWKARRPLSGKELESIYCLYAANVAWNLCYEVMYSYQDVKDDVAAGVRSLAVVFSNPAAGKRLLSVIALAQIVLLANTGRSLGLNMFTAYSMGSVVVTSLTLALKICKVRLNDPESCRWWFARSGLITGTAMLSGLVFEYISRRS